MQGQVKTWIKDKGFGFIERPGEKDLFCHANEFVPPIAFGSDPPLGMEVEFSLATNNGKPCARKIKILGYGA